MQLKYDFTANAGSHFGLITPIADVLDAIPNLYDAWDADSGLTTVEGLVSEWAGQKGNLLSQGDSDLRPTKEDQGLRMFNIANETASATLGVDGIGGTSNGFTVAFSGSMLASQMDNPSAQFLWGASDPLLRMMRQNTPRFRLQVGDTSDVIDLEASSTETKVGVVMVVNGTTVTLHTADNSITDTTATQAGIGSINVAGTSNTQASLIGWARRFGIWKHVPDATQLATIKNWVS